MSLSLTWSSLGELQESTGDKTEKSSILMLDDLNADAERVINLLESGEEVLVKVPDALWNIMGAFAHSIVTLLKKHKEAGISVGFKLLPNEKGGYLVCLFLA